VGSSCSGGNCLFADGNPCTTANQCASGACNTFYVDSDHDTYGAIGSGTALCGSTPPAGYSAQGGDCCDTDARAKPGQTNWYASADLCNSLDYNCSGDVENNQGGSQQTSWGFSGPTGCAQTNSVTCGPQGASPTPSCGQNFTEAVVCEYQGTGSLTNGPCTYNQLVLQVLCH
jgi:hypothetical protein